MTMMNDFALLERYGFRLLPCGLARNEKEVVRIARRIGYPVAIKIVSPEVEHKTDIGGVKVGIRNEPVLRHHYKEIMENAKGKKWRPCALRGAHRAQRNMKDRVAAPVGIGVSSGIAQDFTLHRTPNMI